MNWIPTTSSWSSSGSAKRGSDRMDMTIQLRNDEGEIIATVDSPEAEIKTFKSTEGRCDNCGFQRFLIDIHKEQETCLNCGLHRQQ
jgi:hypothetical protein